MEGQEESQIVNLDSLSAKQRLKEYKLAAKEIKSKDTAKKRLAIEKFKDERYLLEGDCLIPLIEAMAPKKKTLDSTRIVMECFLPFLEKEQNGERICFIGIENIFKSLNSLEVFQTLSDVLMYEEEVKIKKKKKDEPEVPPDPNPDIIKYYGMKAYSIISNVLSKYSTRNPPLMTAFASIPNLLPNLCHVLLYLLNKMETTIIESDKTKIITGYSWILDSLLVCLRYGVPNSEQESPVTVFLKASDRLLPLLRNLYTIDSLTLTCLHIFDHLLLSSEGLEAISNDPDQNLVREILSLAGAASERVGTNLSAATAGSDKKGKAKEKPKGKGASEPPPPPVNTPYDISILAITVKIFTTLSQRAPNMLSSADSVQVLKILSPVVLHPSVWSLCHPPPTVAPVQPDPVLTNFIRETSNLLGCFGIVSENMRETTAREGGIRLLLQLLKNSSVLLGLTSPPPDPPANTKGAANIPPPQAPIVLDAVSRAILSKFRHAVEKSLLHLISIPVEPMNLAKLRWKSCEKFSTDTIALKSTFDLSESNEPQISNLGFILDLLKHQDEDLANRAARLVSTVLQSTNDSIDLFKTLQLYSNAVANLSSLSLKHGLALTNEIDQGQTIEKSEGATQDLSNQIPNLSYRETLCHVYISLEYFLHSDHSPIVTFSTEDQINALSGLLYRCGPMRGKYLQDSEVVIYTEMLVPLFDPRMHTCDGIKEDSHISVEIIFREIIFDLLAIIARADSIYRIYPEIQPPQQPCTPFPPSSCPCAEESLRVIRLCGNPCLAALQCRNTFKLDGTLLVSCPETSLPSSCQLSRPVCEAALGFLSGIGSVGLKGFDVLYQSLAKFGFSRNEAMYSSFIPGMSLLKDFLSHKVVPTLPVTGEKIPDPVDAAFSWTLPIYFEMDPRNGNNLVRSSEILFRKDLWPYLTVIGPLLGLLATPKLEVSTMKLSLETISSFSFIKTISPVIQPAVVDIFSACLLGLGGTVTIAGSIGRYGPLYQIEGMTEILQFILERGKLRQQYWDEYKKSKLLAEAAAEAEVKGGKNAKKDAAKDKPKDKDKGKGKSRPEEEIAIPFEPDPSHNDPNHGPTELVWASYINTPCDDNHSPTNLSQPLTISIQSGLVDISLNLIQYGAYVNETDGLGLSPLCHSLILREDSISRALIAAGADVDQIDICGNPAIKYAYFSLSTDQLASLYELRSKSPSTSEQRLSGNPSFITELLGANIDLNVCDNDGNFPIHYLTGLGSLHYLLGGMKLTIVSGLQSTLAQAEIYNESDSLMLSNSLQQLIQAGAKINQPNKKLITILHVLAALGDIHAIQLVLHHGIYPNALDDMGYLPFHYAASACTANSAAIVNLLLDYGVRRPLYFHTFDDQRTGKSKQEKYMIDSQIALNQILNEINCPNIITLARLTKNDILSRRSSAGLSPSLLALCSGVISISPIFRCLVHVPPSSIQLRFEMFKLLNERYTGKMSDLIGIQAESDSLSTFISPAICFYLFYLDALNCQNLNETTQLSSLISQTLSYLQLSLNDPLYSGDRSCDVPLINSLNVPPTWTILHLAILLSNEELLNILWSQSSQPISIYKFPYIHFMAGQGHLTENIIHNIMKRVVSSPVHGSLLNTSVTIYPMKPIHIAVQAKNYLFLKVFLSYSQVDVNVTDNLTGKTSFHLACEQSEDGEDEKTSLLQIFLDSSHNSDINLLIEDNEKKTVIDYAIETKNLSLLLLFIQYKSTQVLERVLAIPPDGEEHQESLLKRLEDENIEICHKLGYREPVGQQREIEAEEEKNDNPSNDQERESALLPAQEEIVLSPENQAALESSLEKSNDILVPLLSAVKDLNLGNEFHSHQCFEEGVLYCDYCKRIL